jgi:hypothetical protein
MLSRAGVEAWVPLRTRDAEGSEYNRALGNTVFTFFGEH